MEKASSQSSQEPIAAPQPASKKVSKPKVKASVSTDLTPTSPSSRFAHMKDIHVRWSGSATQTALEPSPKREIAHDWRTAIKDPLANNDVVAMKEASQVSAELHLLKLAHEAESESVQLNATMYVLGQGGNGPITKSEVLIDYKKMPDEQLLNQLASNLKKLKKFNPNFDILKQLQERFEGGAGFEEDDPMKVIDVEYAESEA